MPVVSNLITVLSAEDSSFTAGMRRASQQTRDFRATQERELRAASSAAETYNRSLRGSLGNVAQQVQDVAVQFQSGTSAAIIFAQQGPQIAGAFGPVGAIIGALAGVTVVAASAFLGFGKNVDEAKAATEAMEAATKSLDGTIAGSAGSVEDLARKYRVLGEEMRIIERLELGKTIRESEAALSAIRDQIASAVQEASDSGQLALLRQSEALARLDPGATRNAGVVQLQRFLEGLETALAESAQGGLTQFADQIDRLATSLPDAGSDARGLADSFIAPAENAIKLSTAIKQARTALDALAGKSTSGTDPFVDQAKAAEQAEKAVEKATKASAKAAAQSDRRQDALAREIENMRRLVAAGAESTAAYEATKTAIEAESKAIAAGLDPKGREARIIAELTARLDEQAEARRRNTRALDDATKASEKFYEDAAKRIDQMFVGEGTNDNRDVENLQRNLQTNVASAIDRGFEDGFGSVGDLVGQFGSLLKSTVATALADSLITESVAKSIKAGIDAPLSAIAPSLAGTQAGNVAVGNAAAGAAGAAFGGYAIGQQFAGNRALGTLGGAASGAGIGYVVGGPIGAGIGAGIGGIAGFIGSGQTGGTRNNNFDTTIDLATGTTSGGGLKPDAGNVSNVQAVATDIQTLRQGVRAFGVILADARLTIQSGNRSGLTLDGEKFGSLADLNAAALRKALEGATGLSGGQQTALRNSTAKDAAGLLTDLGIPEALDALRRPLTVFEQATKDLATVFVEANDNAERLGLSTRGLAEAQAREQQRLVDAYKAELGILTPLQVTVAAQVEQWSQAKRQLDALGLSEAEFREARADALAATRQAALAQLGFIDPLTQQINELTRVFGEAAKSADFFGKTEAEIYAQRDKLIADARRQALEQQRQALETQQSAILSQMEQAANIIRADFSRKLDQIGDRRRDIAGALNPLSSLRDNILIGDLGNRGVDQRLGSAQTLFDQAVRDARNAGTTAEEAQLLAQRGEALIGLGRDAFGSGAPANDLTRNVLSIVNELTGGLTKEDRLLAAVERQTERQVKAFEEKLPEAIREGTEATAAGLAAAKAELVELRRDVRALNDNLAALARKKA